ncbi:MAG: haloacid dehalogenase [Anaerolineales bacterium]|nr:haloacid dehalogenase [Anaerolineales bacterium]
MHNLDVIADRIRANFAAKNAARDKAVERSRTLIRHCSLAIRAAHRDERGEAREHIAAAGQIVAAIRADLALYPDLYYAGYTQDALKEFAEANIVYALLGAEPLPEPEALGVEYAAYLNGLGEAAGELRRRVLDIIRHDHSDTAEHLLEAMDDIYLLLVTMDYPDAITGGLRRTTDLVRGVTERTRGDLTTSLRQARLADALRALEARGLDQPAAG